MKTQKSQMIGTVLLLGGSALTIALSDTIKTDFLNILKRTYYNVIPIIFIFMVIGKLMCSLGAVKVSGKPFGKIFGKIYGYSDTVAGIYILSLITSYPIGAFSVCDTVKSGKLKKEDAERIIGFCNNTGPGFIFGIIGGVYWKNLKVAVIIYLSQIISSLICGLLFKTRIDSTEMLPSEPIKISAFTDAVAESSTAVLPLIGNIVLFSVLTCQFTKLLPDIDVIKMTAYCITEFTEGCRFSSEIGGYAGIFGTGFSVSFGGISVLFQIMTKCSECGIKPYKYILFKMIHGVLSGMLSVSAAYLFMII